MNKQTLRSAVLAGLFFIPFIPFLVSSSLFFPFITTKAFAFRIVVEIVFALWLALMLLVDEYRPKRSLIMWGVLTFLLVIGVANVFGVEPVKSFWSNFERMEGYITLLHLGGLFLVTGSMFQPKEWKWWWNTSLVASLIMVFYCLFQLSGNLEIHQGGVRVDGTLGNASYLALYFLIHIFIALYYWVKSKTSVERWLYGILIVLQASILYATATRGAILGLIGGLFVIAVLNLNNKENERIKRWSRYALVGLVIFILIFIMMRGTSLVQGSPVLSRFSNLSVSSLKTEGRAFVWPMAIEGIKERPILGWGQDNFNYVFAKNYSAQMYKLEPWFDRAHNSFLDWAIAGGLLGLISYLALYVVILISVWKRENHFSHVEKSVITGLLAAYFFNNFFVFDNLVSYILFFSLLAYVHSYMSVNEEGLISKSLTFKVEGMVMIPVIVFMIFSLYVFNVKPIIANTSLIKALNTNTTDDKKNAMDNFKRAYESSRLGRPEVVEWISSSAPTILADDKISFEERNKYFEFATKAIESVTKDLEIDPRYEMVAGNFYSSVGSSEIALNHLNRAKEVMPEKQMIYFALGQLAIRDGKTKESLEYFKQAYELAPEYEESQVIYLVGAVYAKDYTLIDSLLKIISPEILINDTRVLSVMYQTGQKNLLLSTLRSIKNKLPERSDQIDEYIKQIESGKI